MTLSLSGLIENGAKEDRGLKFQGGVFGFVSLNTRRALNLFHWFFLSGVGPGGQQGQWVALIFYDCFICKLESDGLTEYDSRDASFLSPAGWPGWFVLL